MPAPHFFALFSTAAVPCATAFLLTLACSAQAQAPAAPRAPEVAQVAPVAPVAAPRPVEREVGPDAGRVEQRVERIRVEDAGSRVDELRIGGQTKSITVQPKTGKAPQYNITPSVGARQQPAQRDNVEADGTQRVWRVMGF